MKTLLLKAASTGALAVLLGALNLQSGPAKAEKNVKDPEDKATPCQMAMPAMMKGMGAMKGTKGQHGGKADMHHGKGGNPHMMGDSSDHEKMTMMHEHMSAMHGKKADGLCHNMMKNLSACGEGKKKSCMELHGSMADLMREHLAIMERKMNSLSPKDHRHKRMTEHMQYMRDMLEKLESQQKAE